MKIMEVPLGVARRIKGHDFVFNFDLSNEISHELRLEFVHLISNQFKPKLKTYNQYPGE